MKYINFLASFVALAFFTVAIQADAFEYRCYEVDESGYTAAAGQFTSVAIEASASLSEDEINKKAKDKCEKKMGTKRFALYRKSSGGQWDFTKLGSPGKLNVPTKY